MYCRRNVYITAVCFMWQKDFWRDQQTGQIQGQGTGLNIDREWLQRISGESVHVNLRHQLGWLLPLAMTGLQRLVNVVVTK